MVELNKKLNIAVLGGTFDPPTISHLQIVCEVYNEFKEIDEVWIVPCGDERIDKIPQASSLHRFKMIELLKSDLITKSIPIKVFINIIDR
jgi:cytidyltransferase-like protein